MLCIFEYVGPAGEKFLHRCKKCGQEVRLPSPGYRLSATCGPLVLPLDHGPGTELRRIFAELRVRADGGCGCAEMAAEMDALGVAGCRARRDELAARLKEKAAKFGLSTHVVAAFRAATTGLAARINWLDKFPSLIDLAIERAERASGTCPTT